MNQFKDQSEEQRDLCPICGLSKCNSAHPDSKDELTTQSEAIKIANVFVNFVRHNGKVHPEGIKYLVRAIVQTKAQARAEGKREENLNLKRDIVALVWEYFPQKFHPQRDGLLTAIQTFSTPTEEEGKE